ncbi:MAG: hypothetical protein V3V15_03080 [Sphingorhabdus sp.]
MLGTRLSSWIWYWLRRPALLVASGIWLAYICIGALIIGVDPYDLYPWGKDITVASRHQPFDAARLIRLAAKDKNADTILIGSSPTTMYTPDDIKKAFPGTNKPWNISYHGATAYDREQTLDELVEYSDAKHFIITIDYFYADPRIITRNFPDYMYDDNLTNDLRMINLGSLKASYLTLRYGTPYRDISAMLTKEDGYIASFRNRFQNKNNMAILRDNIENYRGKIAAVGRVNCNEFPMLEPFFSQITALSAKGARVDLIIPAYSPAIYYDWIAAPIQRRLVGRTMLNDQLLMRRCVVEKASQINQVSVSSIDLDEDIVGDLANFRDSGHLDHKDNLMAILSAPEDPDRRITRNNLENYIKKVRNTVLNYQFHNSAFPKIRGRKH